MLIMAASQARYASPSPPCHRIAAGASRRACDALATGPKSSDCAKEVSSIAWTLSDHTAAEHSGDRPADVLALYAPMITGTRDACFSRPQRRNFYCSNCECHAKNRQSCAHPFLPELSR
jgi:hypothetical protein